MTSKHPHIKGARFSIITGINLYRVKDATTDKLTKGRFHTYAQAQIWIDDELARLARVAANTTKERGSKMTTTPPTTGSKPTGTTTIVTNNGITTTTNPDGSVTTKYGSGYYGGGYTPYVACKHNGEDVIWKYGDTNFVIANKDGCKIWKADVILDLNDNLRGEFVEPNSPERFRVLNQYYTDSVLKSAEVVHLDWPDMTACHASLEFWQKMLELLSTSETVMISCHGGHGRSGTALAALIIASKQMNAEAAIEFVRTVHCEKAIETLAQEDYIFILNGEEPPKNPLPKYQRYTHCRQCHVKFKEASKTPDNICTVCDDLDKKNAKLIKDLKKDDDLDGPVKITYFACKECFRAFQVASESNICDECLKEDQEFEDSLFDSETGEWKFPENENDALIEAIERDREKRRLKALSQGPIFAGLDEL